MTLSEIMSIYRGSDALATGKMYDRLAQRGVAGVLAVNLLRACKKSERAKVYTARDHRVASYDGKQWAMDEICSILVKHPALVASWGWGTDNKQTYHRFVLYVELLQGQVSFHTHARGVGPDFPGQWDGKAGMSGQRACAYAASLFTGSVAESVDAAHTTRDTHKGGAAGCVLEGSSPSAPTIAQQSSLLDPDSGACECEDGTCMPVSNEGRRCWRSGQTIPAGYFSEAISGTGGDSPTGVCTPVEGE